MQSRKAAANAVRRSWNFVFSICTIVPAVALAGAVATIAAETLKEYAEGSMEAATRKNTTYDPVLSRQCGSDCCSDCDGLARLELNGNLFIGKCQHECHNSLHRKVTNATDNSQPVSNVLPSADASALSGAGV